jgi:formamidopyrimidine-DNA glycosylase
MPELPEVEILVRHLGVRLQHKTIRSVEVRRARVLSGTSEEQFTRALLGATFTGLSRRGKYLLFELSATATTEAFVMVGHLGMTGRMYVLPAQFELPKHTAVALGFGPDRFVFEDTRSFGKLTLDAAAAAGLGPEPLGPEFSPQYLRQALQRSKQPVKVKLLDQSLVAGVGNIYACEALFRARISPMTPARKIGPAQVRKLCTAIREVLAEAIERGARFALDFDGTGAGDGLFYFGAAEKAADLQEERFCVYGRLDQPCLRCGTRIKRCVQAARSTYYCPRCQRAH